MVGSALNELKIGKIPTKWDFTLSGLDFFISGHHLALHPTYEIPKWGTQRGFKLPLSLNTSFPFFIFYGVQRLILFRHKI